MTQLESLANLGEIIGAVAVVVSLVYLAVQVRQNTRAQRTENFSRALDRIAAIQSSLSGDSETAVVVAKGVVDPENLTPRERIRFTWAMYELFGAFEFIFLASRETAIPEEVWERWSSAGAWWLALPGVQVWWQIRPIPFTRSFTAYVEALLENNPTDPETSRRYENFVSQGKYET